MNELDQAVIAAGNKNYKEFESILDKSVKGKIKNNVKIYMDHLEKNTFSKEKDNE